MATDIVPSANHTLVLRAEVSRVLLTVAGLLHHKILYLKTLIAICADFRRQALRAPNMKWSNFQSVLPDTILKIQHAQLYNAMWPPKFGIPGKKLAEFLELTVRII